MRDAVAATKIYLESVAGVQALLTDGLTPPTYRLFGEELPELQAAAMPRRCAVLRRVPGVGGTRGTVNLEVGLIVAVCYGATPKEAETVREALRDALRDCRRYVATHGDGSKTLLHYFEASTAPDPGRDPDTKWPFVAEPWQFLISEQSIP